MPFWTAPPMARLATGKAGVTNPRPVNIDDPPGREAAGIDTDDICEMIEGRTVLVTGAGGSIGSELCRQVATFSPRTLLMVERSEAALLPIEQELAGHGPRGVIVPLVADILDARRMEMTFARFRPHAVFHAAAHKHAPMMESQPAEAIRNNVLGTARIADLAYEFKAERFLLVSTDKAIHPTSVMGATKRMAEIFVQSMQTRDGAAVKFTAVRFGDVLGPAKVTHPEIARFFMTISEAVSLVLQSAARAEGGEIFVLDRGEAPGTDIAIEELRPNEKLHEELNRTEARARPGHHPKIRRLVSEPLPYFSAGAVLNELAASIQINRTNPDEVKTLLKKIIPEYKPELGDPAPAGS